MSVQAMNWALEQRLVTDASARHVLLCLANYADKDGRNAFPSVASLGEDTGLSERTVRYKLDSLLAQGAIVLGNQGIARAHIDRADRTPTCYDLAMKRGAKPAPRDDESGEGETRCNGCTSPECTGCNLQQHGVQSVQERGARVAPKPSMNHQGTIKPIQGVDAHQRFPMAEGWSPDDVNLAAQLRMQMVAKELITDALVGEFVAWYSSRPSTADTHAGWCNRLVRWAKRHGRKAEASPQAAPQGADKPNWTTEEVLL